MNSGLKRDYNLLLWANIVSATISFASIALVTRILTIEQYGIFVIIQAFVLIVSQLVSFRSWEPLIKFGADAIEANNDNLLTNLIRVSFYVDILSAVAGWLLSLLVAYVLFEIEIWNQSTFYNVAIYSFVVLFNISGFSVGILRLKSKFNLLAFQQVLVQIIKLILISICWMKQLSLTAIIVCWMISELCGQLYLLIFGCRELKEKNIGLIGAVRKIEELKEYYTFLIANYFNATIRAVSREIDVIIIGYFVGKSEAGLYKLAVQMASIVGKITEPLYVILLPMFSKLRAAKEFTRINDLLIKLVVFICIGFVFIYIIAWVWGEELIRVVFPDEYANSYEILMVYLIAIGLIGPLQCIIPLMQAFGKAVSCLKIQAQATIAYILFMIPLCYFYAAVGAAAAYVIYPLAWIVLVRGHLKDMFSAR